MSHNLTQHLCSSERDCSVYFVFLISPSNSNYDHPIMILLKSCCKGELCLSSTQLFIKGTK
jgi:hypothetical protein